MKRDFQYKKIRISTEFERSFRPNSVDIVESYF